MSIFGMQQDYRQAMSRYIRVAGEEIAAKRIDRSVAVEAQRILVCAQKTLTSVVGYIDEPSAGKVAKEFARLVRLEVSLIHFTCNYIPYTSDAFDISQMRRELWRAEYFAERAHCAAHKYCAVAR
jgi:hypothetical protein